MKSLISNTHKGELYAAASGLMYGLVGYFGIHIINAGNGIGNMTFWRCFTSAFIAAAIILPEYKALDFNKYDLFKIFIYGALFYGPCSILFFYASSYIGTGLAMVIFFTYPAMVVIINKFLYKNHISKIYYVSIGAILIGMFFLADLSNAKFNIIGIILGLFSALSYSGYMITSQNVNNINVVLSTCIVSLGCAFSGIVFEAFNGTFFVPQEFSTWINIIGMALISTAIPMLLLLKALQYISATKASILSVLEPVFGVIFGMILLQEKISAAQGFGVVVVLSGAMLALRCKER
jgi:drug/metabolite transporter (DMT)-like permease